MLMGAAAATQDPAARRRYLARQPEAEMFAGFADFALYRIAIKDAHLVAGFGRIVDLGAQEILTGISDAAELIAAEPEIVSQVNADYADAVRLWASELLGGRDGRWRCVGCDPEGLELQLGPRSASACAPPPS
jgi:heme iron utilization protein